MRTGSGVVALALLCVAASGSSAAVIVDGRFSRVELDLFVGSGPLVLMPDFQALNADPFSSEAIGLDQSASFVDKTWGAAEATGMTSQDVDVIVNGSAGFSLNGVMTDRVTANPLAPAFNSASPLAQADSRNLLEYRFTVDAPTAWSLSVFATENPTAAFAASIENLTGGGFAYLSPFESPVDDMAAGVLAPGSYVFRAVADARAFDASVGGETVDEVANRFSLQVGEIPSPCAAALGVLAFAGLGRRRR